MIDLNTASQSIAQAIDLAKSYRFLKNRYDKCMNDLVNMEKTEELIQLKHLILDQEGMIITLKKGLLAVEENQEFERKKQELTHNEHNNLYENKDSAKFCTKCVHERKDFVPVGRTCSKEKERWICKVCDKLYTSIDADARCREEIKEAQRRYNR